MAGLKKVKWESITIRNVSCELKKELIAIAKNNDVSLGSLLKPKLREIANSYPCEMRKFID